MKLKMCCSGERVEVKTTPRIFQCREPKEEGIYYEGVDDEKIFKTYEEKFSFRRVYSE